MSELFEEDDDANNENIGDDFDELEGEAGIDLGIDAIVSRDTDARRRLENMLDEKRLRDELDDFTDY